MNIVSSGHTSIALCVGVCAALLFAPLNALMFRMCTAKRLVRGIGCETCDSPKEPLLPSAVLRVVLRARCKFCGSPISGRYLLVEISTVFAIAATTLWLGISGVLVGSSPVSSALIASAFVLLASASILLSFIDIDVLRLPDIVVFPSLAIFVSLTGLSSLVDAEAEPLLRSVAGVGLLLVGYGVLWLVWPDAMGFGDVKLAALIGCALGWLGWKTLSIGVIVGFVVAGLTGASLVFTRRGSTRSHLPFGPWMLLGAWAAILLSESM